MLRDSPRHLAAWQWPPRSPAAGVEEAVCVIPRRTTLELGLGAAALWLGTRQSGCNSTARADKPVPSLLQPMPCSRPDSWDHRGHDTST